MTDEAARLLLVIGVLALAGLVAALISRIQRPPHPTLVVHAEGARPGVVLFTSLDCTTCKKTVALLRSNDVAFREITHELEPQRFESWGVLAVPLTVVLDDDGGVVDAITGVPSSRRLAGALRTAGLGISA
jgi:hypothetical protein